MQNTDLLSSFVLDECHVTHCFDAITWGHLEKATDGR